MILNAQSDGAARRKAMQELVTSYWKPLYYYSRRKGRDPEAAKDAIQGFITHLLEREFLDRRRRRRPHPRLGSRRQERQAPHQYNLYDPPVREPSEPKGSYELY